MNPLIEHRRPRQQRRRQLSLAALAVLLIPFGAAAQKAGPLVEVWKSPSCGCCKDWVAHLEANGFRTKVNDSGNTAIRAQFGLPERYGSCHTAKVDGYVVEGHVPAADIHRLLKQRPAALGLAVPAMPIGSPGMDGPEYGGRRDPYDVLLITREGTSSVFQSHR